MNIDDAITLIDLAARFMESDAKIKGKKPDDGTSQLIEAINIVCKYAKQERLAETLRRLN